MSRDYIELKFEENLTIAKEEFPAEALDEQIRQAEAWTVVAVQNYISRLVERRRARHQEATNQTHFG